VSSCANMGHLVVVQVISTRWDKAARGGALATRRNRVPEALPLPPLGQTIREPSYITHTVNFAFFGGGLDGRPVSVELMVLPTADPFTCGAVQVRLKSGQIHADFHWTHAVGAPERPSVRNALVLEKGQWGAFSTMAGRPWQREDGRTRSASTTSGSSRRSPRASSSTRSRKRSTHRCASSGKTLTNRLAGATVGATETGASASQDGRARL
jgi:hypothetical protein